MQGDTSSRVLAEQARRSDDDVFPPQTSRVAEIEALIHVLRGVFPTRAAVYVSAPITSGRRFIEWYSRGREIARSPEQYQREHVNDVVGPNRDAVVTLVNSVRETTSGLVIDPSAVGHIEGWTQGDYRTVWGRIIEEFVRTVVFADGWEFSHGCAYEFLIATRAGLETLDESWRPIDLATGVTLLRHAIRELSSRGLSAEFLKGIVHDLGSLTDGPPAEAIAHDDWLGKTGMFKDAVLDAVAHHGNVAQFVSFSPSLETRYSRIVGYLPNASFESPRAAIDSLLAASIEHSVNIRSYHPQHPKSREFIYGLRDVESAEAVLRRLAAQGLYTIVNETVDVNDGGVSGVVLGDVIEFAPGDTPRCVEKPGTVSLRRSVGLSMLQRVYGFAPAFPSGRWRIEFSVHPLPRGHRQGHTILWEAERENSLQEPPRVRWPNHFSRFLGDKTFGLLLADCLGFPVPATVVIARNVAPFEFGRNTGTAQRWIRTAPREPMPGRFTTLRGWTDPFNLLAREDPNGEELASVMSQEGVRATFSGASIAAEGQPPIVEGVEGLGPEFMLGQKPGQQLPLATLSAVNDLMADVLRVVGAAAKVEWAFDGEVVWILQMQQLSSAVDRAVVVPGDAKRFRNFDATAGIDRFRQFVRDAKNAGDGVIVIGAVGVTSHFGDILRRSGVPSRIEMPV